MTTDLLDGERKTPIVEYSVSDAAIERLRDTYKGLTAETPAKYRMVVSAIAEVRDLRVRVEKTRKELKADALEYGRKVDAEAKRITALLVAIEEPLKITKQVVDDEKDRIRREKEEAERAAIEAELASKRAAEEAAAKAEQDRIRQEQEAEAARLAEERRKIEAERAAQEAKLAEERAKADAERKAAEEKLAAERRAIVEERRRLERIEFERQAKERAEREAREKMEREAEAKRQRELREAEEAERLREIRPDMVKLADFARELQAIKAPNVTSSEAIGVLDRVMDAIGIEAQLLLQFATKHGAN